MIKEGKLKFSEADAKIAMVIAMVITKRTKSAKKAKALLDWAFLHYKIELEGVGA
jgi:hypothetical protein